MNGSIDHVIGKRIMIAPLNWGLGHATRCIPIIRKLLSQKNEVIIASDGESLALLNEEFELLASEKIPSYDIRYPHESMVLNMALQSRKILHAIRKEHNVAANLSRKHKIDVCISDNRLGFYAHGTYNIYITHQLHIPHPSKLVAMIADYIHHRHIDKYDTCWVPDYEGKVSLAGKMSAGKIGIKKYFLGPLSRLTSQDAVGGEIDFLAILSGPEPQRTVLEVQIIALFSQYPNQNLAIVRGTNFRAEQRHIPAHIKMYDRLGSQDLNPLINQAKTIICRSGYTSIMDLVALNKAAILIPTPGQYEQEYLSKRLNGRYGFTTINQKSISNLDLEQR